jgi:hypothetical protein
MASMGKSTGQVRQAQDVDAIPTEGAGHIAVIAIEVIERAVILSEGDIFSVDETWLNRQTPQSAGRTVALNKALHRQEKEMIEAALAESAGRVSGPDGAAVQQDVRESGSPVDSAGAVVARAAVADVVFGAHRAAADGRDRLQHFVPLVRGAEYG